MPPAMAGPGPSNDPPRPETPFTVSYERTVSTSQTIFPSAAEYARRWPSTEPENAIPGIALTAADCAGLHLGRSPHSGGGVYQALSPFSRRRANMPPPAFGSTSELALYVSEMRPTSDKATYTFD